MRLSASPKAEHFLAPRSAAQPPAWAVELAGGEAPQPLSTTEFHIDCASSPRASLTRLILHDAMTLHATELERRASAAYIRLRELLPRTNHPHPLRFWNFLPGINQMMDAQRDRYMVFNAGRFAAFDGWFSDSGEFSSRLPAASAVGHDSSDLLIYCLSASMPGAAIENPRQIPAFDYSARYGPRPPCFARATIANAINGDAGALLISSGTASIVGEQTVHRGDLAAQIDESLANLRTLLESAHRQTGTTRATHLSAFHSVRIYYPNPQHHPAIADAATTAFGPHTQLELIRANLCRPDLLVEIEGIANLGPLSGSAVGATA